jgi:DNA polymerase III epsilon subunit-like protein
MIVGFLDLETTGLPTTISFYKYHDPTETKYYDTSRIVQIALITYDFIETDGTVEYKMVSEHDYIIKPDRFVIRNAHIHHITQEIADAAGITFAAMIEKIKPDILRCDLLVAHNILFDKNVLLSELHRYSMNDMVHKVLYTKTFCTSVGCRNITRLKKRAGEYKQPKLAELYKFLFDKDAVELHNALNDTRAMVLCFFEMVKRKLIVCIDGRFYQRQVEPDQ